MLKGLNGAEINLKQVYDFLKSFNYNIFRSYNDGIVDIPQWDDSLENYRSSNYIAIENVNLNVKKIETAKLTTQINCI